jgi:hypothetical protein
MDVLDYLRDISRLGTGEIWLGYILTPLFGRGLSRSSHNRIGPVCKHERRPSNGGGATFRKGTSGHQKGPVPGRAKLFLCRGFVSDISMIRGAGAPAPPFVFPMNPTPFRRLSHTDHPARIPSGTRNRSRKGTWGKSRRYRPVAMPFPRPYDMP